MNRQTQTYLDIVGPLNESYRTMIDAYCVGDTKPIYLKRFEISLSMHCPDRQIWQMKLYKETEGLLPLIGDDYTKIDREAFRCWIMTYEQIMRDVGLIDKISEEKKEIVEQIECDDFVPDEVAA